MVVQPLSLQAGEAVLAFPYHAARSRPTLLNCGGEVGLLVLVLIRKGTVLFYVCLAIECYKIHARLRQFVFSLFICWFRF